MRQVFDGSSSWEITTRVAASKPAATGAAVRGLSGRLSRTARLLVASERRPRFFRQYRRSAAAGRTRPPAS